MSGKIKESCIVSLILIAAELVFSIILKSKSAASSVVIGEEGKQSLVYFMPAAAGIVLYAVILFNSFLLPASFKAFARGSIPKWFAFFGAWLLNAAVSVQSVIKTSTMELFSFESGILRIVQFVVILFAVLSCFIVKGARFSK